MKQMAYGLARATEEQQAEYERISQLLTTEGVEFAPGVVVSVHGARLRGVDSCTRRTGSPLDRRVLVR